MQAQRFQLVDDDAVAHLLVLAHDAPSTLALLEQLQRSGTLVIVKTAPADGLIATVATEVFHATDIIDTTEDPFPTAAAARVQAALDADYLRIEQVPTG